MVFNTPPEFRGILGVFGLGPYPNDIARSAIIYVEVVVLVVVCIMLNYALSLSKYSDEDTYMDMFITSICT
jgi:hypothetical protein